MSRSKRLVELALQSSRINAGENWMIQSGNEESDSLYPPPTKRKVFHENYFEPLAEEFLISGSEIDILPPISPASLPLNLSISSSLVSAEYNSSEDEASNVNGELYLFYLLSQACTYKIHV
ncbi:uncharacterized protein LOC124159831 [Ischnura elegans]|uniref:uncharacterized protein LOC124159831 n=1 Tax=Ischnura elegans TaxID=197161 RepID=UPI001ED86D27|nr:uncharacterized protein LOC124159831 [Ischnura elegans]